MADKTAASGVGALVCITAFIEYLVFVRTFHAEPADLYEFIAVPVIFNIGFIFLAIFAVAPYLVFVELPGLFLRGVALMRFYDLLLFGSGGLESGL